MFEKIEILFVILSLLLIFYVVIAWGAKSKKNDGESIKIKNYLFGVRVVIIFLAIVSLILWSFT